MVSVTDVGNLLEKYLDHMIDREEFSRTFLATYVDVEEMKDRATFDLSCAVHFPLADAMVGLISEEQLRAILAGLQMVDVRIEERYKEGRSPLPLSPTSSKESSAEVHFQSA